VLSTKEAQKNVEMEKIRRDKIRQGIPEDPSELHQQREQLKSKTAFSKTFLSDPEKRLLNWKRFNPSTVQLGQRFVGAYLGHADIPPLLGVPEIAFLGRSNVGKSSCLNVLSSISISSTTSTGNNIRARVGKTPGATASVNMYAMFDSRKKASSHRDVLAWVDMPGFGYAQLSKSTQERIQKAAEQYLENRRQSPTNSLALAILLVDIRRNPSDDDRGVLAALFDRNIPVLVVATKVDKTTTNERAILLRTIQEGLGLPEGQPLCISSVTQEGVKMLWNIILEACETHVADLKSRYVDDHLDEEDDKEDHEIGLEEEEDVDFFDDSDDLMYDQGYDWDHLSMELDEDPYDFDLQEEIMNNDRILDDKEERSADNAALPPQKTFRSLQKKARKMEERGEV
jgi:GTP-binding protein